MDPLSLVLTRKAGLGLQASIMGTVVGLGNIFPFHKYLGRPRLWIATAGFSQAPAFKTRGSPVR